MTIKSVTIKYGYLSHILPVNKTTFIIIHKKYNKFAKEKVFSKYKVIQNVFSFSLYFVLPDKRIVLWTTRPTSNSAPYKVNMRITHQYSYLCIKYEITVFFAIL